MIECRNLAKNYGTLTAVSDISLHLREQEFISILGSFFNSNSASCRLESKVLYTLIFSTIKDKSLYSLLSWIYRLWSEIILG